MAFVRNNNNNNRRHNNYGNNRHRHPNANNANPNNGGQRRHVNRINQVFESNGPDGRIRGTAQQIVEKYATLARDALISGDKVLSTNYLQHGEHYQRLLNEITEENATFEREREEQRQAQQAAQPQISQSDAEAGFAAQAGDQPQLNAVEAPQRQERPQRGPRPERGERPQQREKRPADDIDDNELPSFLHVPITTGKPDDAAAPAKATRAVPGLRPRRTAAAAPAADKAADEAPTETAAE